jgi:class 3 adenylate cyclase
MFADISGFTAWASVREPSQVFTLLEAIYHSFDHIAKKRRVFKVETIGDCYVAVTGLSDPQDDHAVIMGKFAMECMLKMNELTQKLEVSLGPDTGDLKMRFGLHSGPVTAGVLRGEKSRFQLFGNTVNTAARMESTGKTNHIQCSQATVDLLIAGGKSHWICPRDEIVRAKGKGEVQTFWIDPKGKNSDPFSDSSAFDGSRRSLASSARNFLKRDISMSTKSLV